MHRARRLDEDAWEAVERGKLGEAEKTLRRAIATRADDCVAWNDLGLILWKKGELREAEKMLRNALQLRADYEDARMNLAALLASRGFYRQALRLEEEMAAPGAPHAEFHRKKAEEYREMAARRTR